MKHLADFSTNMQPIDPGRSKTIDFGLDSRLGGQADIELGKYLQFTQRRPVRDFKPEISFAHLPFSWVHPPSEVYGLIPLIYEDGLNASWRLAIGNGPYNNHAPDYNDQHPPRERLISVGVDFIF